MRVLIAAVLFVAGLLNLGSALWGKYMWALGARKIKLGVLRRAWLAFLGLAFLFLALRAYYELP